MRKSMFFILIAALLLLVSIKAAWSQAAGIDALILDESDASHACDPHDFWIKVTNLDAEFQDIYSFSVEPYSQYASFDRRSALILPGRSAYLNLSLTLPCDVSGLIKLDLVAENDATGERWYTPLDYEIRPDGIPSVSPSVDVIRIGHNKSQASLKIRNTGSVPASFKVWLEGSDFAKLASDHVDIPGQQEGSVKMVIDPPSALEEGDYPITFVALSNITEAEYAKDIILRLEQRSSLSIFLGKYWMLILVVLIVLAVLVFLAVYLSRYLAATKEQRHERKLAREAEKAEAKALKEKEAARKEEEQILARQQKEKAAQEKKESKLMLKEAKRKEKEERRKEKARVKVLPYLLHEIYSANLVIPRDGVDKGRKGWGFYLVFAVIILLLGAWIFWIGTAILDYIGFIIVGLLLGLLLVWVIRSVKRKMMDRRLVLLSDELESLRKKVRSDLNKENIIVNRSDVEMLKGKRSIAKWIFLVFAVLLLWGLSALSVILGPSLGPFWLWVAIIAVFMSLVICVTALALWHARKDDELVIPIGDIAANRIIDCPLRWKKGIRSVAVKIENAVEGIVVGAYRLRNQPTFMDPEGIPFGFFEFKSNVEGKDIERVDFGFTVDKKWMSKQDIDPDTVCLQRYVNGRWKGLETAFVSEGDKTISFRAESPGLSFFCITGEKRAPVEAKPVVSPIVSSRKDPKKALVAVPKDAQKDKGRRISPTVEPDKVEALFESRKSRRSNRRWLSYLIIVLIILLLTAGLWLYWPSISAGMGSLLGDSESQGAADSPAVDQLPAPTEQIPSDDGLDDAISQATDAIDDVSTSDEANVSRPADDVSGGVSDTNSSVPIEAGNESVADVSGSQSGVVSSDYGIPPQSVNGTLILDLNQYFSDPDGEQLVYSNSRADNLIISYEHGVASIVPKEGFSGEEVVTFYASDSQNMTVSSNPVTFKVTDPKALARPAASSQRVLIGVALFVVLIAVVIILVFLRKSKEFGEDEDKDK